MFSSIRNYFEFVVFEEVVRRAPEFPALAASEDLLADVACVALNRLPARYIRHPVDMHFYRPEADRLRDQTAIDAAVAFAFEFVSTRAQKPTGG